MLKPGPRPGSPLVPRPAAGSLAGRLRAGGDDLHLLFQAMLGPDCAGDRLREQGETYSTLLEGAARYRLAGGQLEIRTVRDGSLLFEPLPQGAQPALEGPARSLLGTVAPTPSRACPRPSPSPTPSIPCPGPRSRSRWQGAPPGARRAATPTRPPTPSTRPPWPSKTWLPPSGPARPRRA